MRFLVGILIGIIVISSCTSEKQQQQTEAIEKDTTKLPTLIEVLNEKIKVEPNNAQLYFERAKENQKLGNKEEALSDIDRAIYVDSLKGDFFAFKAEVLFKNKEVRKAKEQLDRGLANDNNCLECYMKLAEINFYANKYKEALKAVNGALKIDVYSSRAYFLKGMIFKYNGDTASAISSFQTVIEQNSDYYDAYMQLGVLFDAQNNVLAESYYNNAIMLKPESQEAIYSKSLFMQKKQDYATAQKGYRLLLKINPEHQDAHYNLGYIKLLKGEDVDSAAMFFQNVLNINPLSFNAYYNLGVSYEKLGDLKKAEINYRAALKLKPDYDLAARGLQRVIG